nr:Ig-like V-type domain-containing protein FAM187A isoform X2 [Danaus plexippus plexippus]
MPGFYVTINIYVFIIYFVDPIFHEYDGKLNSITSDLNNKYTNTPVKLTYSSNKNTKNDIFEDVNAVPKVIVRTYSGAVAILPCKIKVSKLWNKTVIWLQKTTFSYKPVQEDDGIITDYNLTIFNVRTVNAGDYRCVTDEQLGVIATLEVIDEEQYNVKPATSKGPYPMKPVWLNSLLVMLSVWSDWSECSQCGAVGRRRRYGMCYVSRINEFITTNFKSNMTKSDGESSKLFKVYPDGIPCRSRILPPSIRNTPSVQERPNEIMLGLCRVRCKEAIVNIRSESGDIIESVNNTAGIYSLHQNAPSQPQLPARRIMYVEPGERVIIICHGTTLRDIPFTWRVDTHEVSPKYLWSASGDRIHLNARDHIIIKHVLYSDARVYSCWQDGVLCGVVKLRVNRSTKTTTRLRLRLLIFILILAIVLRLTLRLIRCRVRYLGIQV